MSSMEPSAQIFEFRREGHGLDIAKMTPYQLFVLDRMSQLALTAMDMGAPRENMVKDAADSLGYAIGRACIKDPDWVNALVDHYTQSHQPQAQQLFGVSLLEALHNALMDNEASGQDSRKVLMSMPPAWRRLSQAPDPAVRESAYQSLCSVADLYARGSVEQERFVYVALALDAVKANWQNT